MSINKQVGNRTARRTFVKYKSDEPTKNHIEVTRIVNKVHNIQNSRPLLSVIIPTSDGYRNGFFPALLNQIYEQSFQNFETIVVKGDSKQGRAINTGVDLARGKYVLTLDDDTSLHTKNAFSLLVQVMDNHKNIGMAGGINVIPADAPSFIRRAMLQIPRRSTPQVEKIIESDLAEHPLLIMRKEDFKSIGGENELLPRGLDPYLRSEFRNAGYKVVVVPKVYYSHLPPPTLMKLIKQFFRNGKQAAFCNKYYPQWVIETPATHVNSFIEKRPFLYRFLRHLKEFMKNTLKGHWLYLAASASYAFGFIYGYARSWHDA
jgi:glycosyltransferase involved in cell wall biosynthesis